MSRYIDADEVLNKLNSDDSLKHARSLIKSVVLEQPTADVLPVVHGFWIDINNYGIKERKCSNCGKKDNPKTAIKGHYCWNCGAKMGGETNDT